MKNRKYIIELVSKIKTLENSELEDLFEAFFTPQELDVLEMRYRLIAELLSGSTQRDISKKLNISLSQITRGSRELKYGAGKKIFPKLFDKTVLEKIIENKQKEISLLKVKIPENINSLQLPKILSFYESLKRANFGIICEVKVKSPSKDLITNNSPVNIATEYIKANVEAISILTDKKYFGGDFGDIQNVHKITDIPILCKDFVIDKKQIYQARLAGASAVLLIVKALQNKTKIQELMTFAGDLGMDALVEINNEKELDLALCLNPKIVGVNSRNLDTLEINKNIFQDLFPKIPDTTIKLALSGIESTNDIQKVKNLCNGVLVGTSLCCLPLHLIRDKISEFKSVL